LGTHHAHRAKRFQHQYWCRDQSLSRWHPDHRTLKGFRTRRLSHLCPRRWWRRQWPGCISSFSSRISNFGITKYRGLSLGPNWFAMATQSSVIWATPSNNCAVYLPFAARGASNSRFGLFNTYRFCEAPAVWPFHLVIVNTSDSPCVGKQRKVKVLKFRCVWIGIEMK